MWGRATLAMEESRTSMKVAKVTVMATIQGLMRGRHGFSTSAGAEDEERLSIWRVAVAMLVVLILWGGSGIQESLHGTDGFMDWYVEAERFLQYSGGWFVFLSRERALVENELW